MQKIEIITATEASRAFSELLHRVCYGGESFLIKKGNRLMARIVPVDEVEKASKPAKKSGSSSPKMGAQQDTSEQERPQPILPPKEPGTAPPSPQSPYDAPDYYKQVLAEIDKMLSK